METTTFWQKESNHLNILYRIQITPQHTIIHSHTCICICVCSVYILLCSVYFMEKYANSICLLSKCVYVKYKMIYELGLVSEGIYINCNSVPLCIEIQVPIFSVASVEQRCKAFYNEQNVISNTYVQVYILFHSLSCTRTHLHVFILGFPTSVTVFLACWI